MGATGLRYIKMGQPSHIQNDNNWDLEETIRKAEEKFTTNLKTIATETTNDERLLKPLVCLGKKRWNKYPTKTGPTRNSCQRDSALFFFDDELQSRRP